MAAPGVDCWYVLFLRYCVFCLCVCAWKYTSVVLKWAVLLKEDLTCIWAPIPSGPGCLLFAQFYTTLLRCLQLWWRSQPLKWHPLLQKDKKAMCDKTKHEHIYSEWYTLGLSGPRGHNLISQNLISIGRLRNARKSRFITWSAKQPVSLSKRWRSSCVNEEEHCFGRATVSLEA